jgi:N-acetylglucosamine-6-phosphate deacetylase
LYENIALFNHRQEPDVVIDGHGVIIAPGYIDIQINGAFGVDFSTPSHMETDEGECSSCCCLPSATLISLWLHLVGLRKVARGILNHGVTSFVPTVITSEAETYHKLLPILKPRKGSPTDGAEVLGCHIEVTDL